MAARDVDRRDRLDGSGSAPRTRGRPVGRERPQVIIVRQGGDHGCLITILLLVVAWPLAILYWLLRLMAWVVGSAFDWLTGGPVRRRRR